MGAETSKGNAVMGFIGFPRINPGEKDGWQQSDGKAGQPLITAGYAERILQPVRLKYSFLFKL